MASNNDYILNCIEEFRKSGFAKKVYTDFEETSNAVRKLIELLVTLFISEVSKMKSSKDVLEFVRQYDASNKIVEGDVAFKHLCKSIFVILPKLKLSSTASSVFHNQHYDISMLMNIHSSIMMLCQVYGILLATQQGIVALIVSENGWSFHFSNDEYYEKNTRFQLAIKNGALNGYCDKNFVSESFIETYRKVFNSVEEELYQRIFNSTFIYDAHKLKEIQFIGLLRGSIPQQGIIDVTDIVLNNKHNPCIKGLLFDDDNSDLLMSFLKPHNPKYRTRFRPILKVNIDDSDRYITTQSIYFEAITQLATGQFAHNDLPEEWQGVKVLKDKAKTIFKQHSITLEDIIEQFLQNSNYSYLRNVTSIANVSCVKAPVFINGSTVDNKTVGEIDYIIIDDNSKSIYVVDAKFLKPTFFYMTFPVDADKFRKVGGYENKLEHKIQWITNNINLLSTQLNKPVLMDYNVDGFFVTDNLVYYSLFSKFPIIPVSNLLEYISSNNRYCFLPKI